MISRLGKDFILLNIVTLWLFGSVVSVCVEFVYKHNSCRKSGKFVHLDDEIVMIISLKFLTYVFLRIIWVTYDKSTVVGIHQEL